MDFHPPKPALTKRFCFAENKQPTGEIITDMIQVRRDRVSTTSEVNIVGQIECVAQKLEEWQR